jgi:hypothetical protein
MTDQAHPRRRGLAAVAVAAVIAAAVLVLSRTPSSSGAPAQPPVAAASVPAPGVDAVGPATRRHGVPVGWRHDASGATAAAIGDVRTIELVAAVGPLERQDIIRVFTTAAFGPSLTAKTNGQLDDLLFALGARGRTGADLIWHEFPLTARVDAQAPDEMVVEVWSVSLVLVTGGSVARQSWHTETVGLVWQDGDWKVDRWSSQPGPTPGLASEADLSPVPAVQANASWPAVSGRS